MSRTLVLFSCLAAVSVLLAMPGPAFACLCTEVEPAVAFADADAAFVGVVMDQRDAAPVQDLGPGAISHTLTYGARVTRFAVQEAFLGVEGKEVLLHETGTNCDMVFVVGERYVVYAYKADDGRLYTNMCSRTALIAKATSDLAYLRRVKSRSESGIVTGRITRFFYDVRKNRFEETPMRNAKVIFKSSKRAVVVRTDPRGRFTIRGLPMGNYAVRTEPKTNTSSLGGWDEHGLTEWQTEISGHGTVNLWFGTESPAKVTGRVLDSNGQGVPHVDIEITPVDRGETEIRSQSGWTEQDGRFTFEAVWPGKYVLGFNVNDDPSLNDPYPRFYFPGVSEAGNASVITIADGTTVSGLELPIPPRLREVAVTGIAYWPDGTPARQTWITLKHPRTGYSEGNGVTTDGEGRFTITGLEGVTYHLSAKVNDGFPLVDSVPQEVTAGATAGPVRLVITLPPR